MGIPCMAIQLVALSEGASFNLEKPIVLIGRHEECDIIIDSRKVSRKHCCIVLFKDHAMVRDLGSTNGVKVDGKSVIEGKILPGQELCIGGHHRYVLHWDIQEPAAKNGHS